MQCEIDVELVEPCRPLRSGLQSEAHSDHDIALSRGNALERQVGLKEVKPFRFRRRIRDVAKPRPDRSGL